MRWLRPAAIGCCLLSAACVRAYRPVSEICTARPEAGVFCLYHNEAGWKTGLGWKSGIELAVDDQALALLREDEWAELVVPPGRHRLSVLARSSVPPQPSVLELDVEAGAVYPVRVVLPRTYPVIGPELFATVELTRTDALDARQAIYRDCTPGELFAVPHRSEALPPLPPPEPPVGPYHPDECPAEAQPAWKTASAETKRDMLRRCPSAALRSKRAEP